MPQWIHDRAKHIQAKNPSMPESEAWAIATQQSHATGHTPKGYGTAKGKHEAKEKYDTPGDDVQTANPKTASLRVATISGLREEMAGILEKKANLLPAPENALTQMKPASPKQTMGIKKHVAPYSQPKTTPPMSPSQGAQPTAGAPPVRT